MRVVIGDRGLKAGKLEIKWRWEKAAGQIELEGAGETLIEMVRTERHESTRFRNR